MTENGGFYTKYYSFLILRKLKKFQIIYGKSKGIFQKTFLGSKNSEFGKFSSICYKNAMKHQLLGYLILQKFWGSPQYLWSKAFFGNLAWLLRKLLSTCRSVLSEIIIHRYNFLFKRSEVFFEFAVFPNSIIWAGVLSVVPTIFGIRQNCISVFLTSTLS